MSSLIIVEGSASSFKASYFVRDKECGIEANIDNQTLIINVYNIISTQIQPFICAIF